MKLHAQGYRESKALAFAAIVSLVLGLVPAPAPESTVGSRALDDLLDARTAQTEGAWWLDDPTATAQLSFAREHDRLVWRVGTDEHRVLLDAATGEALAFEFD
jgi:hypothetical protein